MASSGGDPSGFVGRGVCMMNTSWRDKQHPNLINFITTFLTANSYRLNFLSVSPDFIFNNGGLSVAFVFETNWDCEKEAAIFSRVNTLKRQFKNLYVVVTVPTAEQNESFNQSYFKYGMELGCPTFVPVLDPEMGFENIVKIAHARGVCKQQDIISTMRNEREQAVQCMDAFLRVLASIPGIDSHDANAIPIKPGETHWVTVKNILKYLRGTIDMFLVYGDEEELVINGHTNTSFQTDKDNSKSQSGFMFCLNGGAVSWKGSQQETVADSMTEAEYIAASAAAKEAVWTRKFCL